LDIFFSKPNPYQPPTGGARDPKHSINIPTSGEISIITVGPDAPKHPGFILPMGNGELRFIPYTDANSDPVCFFLLFPCGEMGWDGSWQPAKKDDPQKPVEPQAVQLPPVPAQLPLHSAVQDEKEKEVHPEREGENESKDPPYVGLPLATYMYTEQERQEMEKEGEDPSPYKIPNNTPVSTHKKDEIEAEGNIENEKQPLEDPLPFPPNPDDPHDGAAGFDSD
jgi:hypothetical protein